MEKLRSDKLRYCGIMIQKHVKGWLYRWVTLQTFKLDKLHDCLNNLHDGSNNLHDCSNNLHDGSNNLHIVLIIYMID